MRDDAAPSAGEHPAQVLRRAIAHVETLLQRVDPAAVRRAGAEPIVVPLERLGSVSSAPVPRSDASRLIDQAAADRERVLAEAREEAAAIVAAASRAASDIRERVTSLLAALRSATRSIEQALEIAGDLTASVEPPVAAIEISAG